MGNVKPRSKDEQFFDACTKGSGRVVINMKKLSFQRERSNYTIPGAEDSDELESSFCEVFAFMPGFRSAQAELFNTPDTSEITLLKRGGDAFIEPIGETVLLKPITLSRATKMPRRLVRDVYPNLLAQCVGRHFGEVAARGSDKYFTNGDGINEPQGLAYDTTGVPTMSCEEALGTKDHCERISWMMHSDTLRNLYLGGGKVTHGPKPELLGHRVHCNNFLDVGTVVVGDFRRGYAIRDTDSAEILVEPHSEPDAITLRLTYRVDGKVLDPDALLIFKSSS